MQAGESRSKFQGESPKKTRGMNYMNLLVVKAIRRASHHRSRTYRYKKGDTGTISWNRVKSSVCADDAIVCWDSDDANIGSPVPLRDLDVIGIDVGTHRIVCLA